MLLLSSWVRQEHIDGIVVTMWRKLDSEHHCAVIASEERVDVMGEKSREEEEEEEEEEGWSGWVKA